MLNNPRFVDLTFPMLEYGTNETQWDLTPLLYRGGATTKVKAVSREIVKGTLGGSLPERFELVKRLHECLVDDLTGGGSRFSANNKIGALRKLFEWADLSGCTLSLNSAAEVYLRWTEHLLHLHRVEGRFSKGSLYDLANLTATMLDRVLGRHSTLLYNTRIRKPRGKGKGSNGSADKQSLESSFAFGHFLADICNALTFNATTGALPVRIPLRTGEELNQWCRLHDPAKTKSRGLQPQKQSQKDAILRKRAIRIADRTLDTRYPVVNLRIEAELLMFIAQTGMNLKQVHMLRMDQYHYTSHLDGYQVRTYKNRRQGEVLFEIFSSYREWFERYLVWRSEWFPDDPEGLLFPLVRVGGRLVVEAPQLTALIRVCAEINVELVRPRKLRGTRINWLLRESLNPQAVAELAQHTAETLIRVYADPHPQVAMVEITRFHQLTALEISPPAPGSCVSAIPEPMTGTPKSAPEPDCINAAGCLFCANHRDIESEDHVWSLSSLRVLKGLELARYRPPASGKLDAFQHPAMLAVERLTSKLRFFEESSQVRRLWVEEARARINEEDYHPAWDGFIRLAEVQQELSK